VRPADGLVIDVLGTSERDGVAMFFISWDGVGILFGERIRRKGRNGGSGDVSAAEDKAINFILSFVDRRVDFGGDVTEAACRCVGTSSSSSEETRTIVDGSAKGRPPVTKGRSLDEDEAIGFGSSGDGERDHSLPVSSLGRLASCSWDVLSFVSGDWPCQRFSYKSVV
jgi:hypothetical protein